MPTLPFLQNFKWAFVQMDSVNVPAKFEVRSFTRSWDNSGYLKTLGSPWIRPRSIFSEIFDGLLFRWTCECTVTYEVRSFTRSWDNRGYLKTLGSPWIRRSRSSKVIDFGTNRNPVCDFLLVRHSSRYISCSTVLPFLSSHRRLFGCCCWQLVVQMHEYVSNLLETRSRFH